MARVSRFTIAKNDIIKLFEEREQAVYTMGELSLVHRENRAFWRLPMSMTDAKFVDQLLRSKILDHVQLDFPNRVFRRYIYKKASTLQVALSIQKNGHLSHLSALSVHELTEQIPRTIYISTEQSKKFNYELTQEGIDNAFAKPQRVSKNFAEYENTTIYLLTGMNTNNLGVIEVNALDFNGKIPVTNLERTLIDIAVRPSYAGGISEVIKAYQNASPKVSINRLAAYLKKINFTYPYQQTIGFYLEKSGMYRDSQVNLLRKEPFMYDFYLTYNMKQKAYSKSWKLYYPQNL